MISVLSYNRLPDEQKIVEKGCRHEIARRTEAKLNFIKVPAPGDLVSVCGQDQLIDIIYYEVTDKMDVEQLKTLRRNESAALLMLLTTSRVSPMMYLKPGIAPDLLLLRPFTQSDFNELNEELFDEFETKMSAPDEEEKIIVHSRDGKAVFPFYKISFFEANNKKIHIRIGNEEYDFYDSIDNLMRKVPDYFARCHRSYLVNTKKIKKVKLADGIIELDMGAAIPLSRSYKSNFKSMNR